MSSRKDSTGLTVKVTSFGGLRWGVRILRNGKILVQVSVDSKNLIGACIGEELRWLNKLADPSPMADASRHRRGKKNR